MLELDSKNELNTQIQYRLIEKLTESERRYRERVENLREIVFECDRTGQLTFVNRAWTSTLGYPVSEAIGQTLSSFLSDRDVEQWQTALHQKTDCQIELRFPHQTGKLLWLELTMQFSQTQTCHETISGSLINITERKQAEAILQEHNEALETRVQQRTAELRESNQTLQATLKQLQSAQGQLVHTEKMSSLGQLVAGVAHEINNPVSFVHGNLQPAYTYAQSLIGLLELYQQYYPTPVAPVAEAFDELDIEFIQADFPKLLNSMQMGTKRIQTIVNSLRSFSRLDETGLKTVDIHDGLENTLLILSSRFKAEPPYKTIQLIKEYGKLPPVQCFPGQLNQVFLNLLANAIDALRSPGPGNHPADPNPTITVRTEVAGSDVVITIADNGSGIPDAVMASLFNPFFTTKPVGKGTGLGLSISHQIVTERHGGSLQCRSTAEAGTDFIVRIPLLQPKTSGALASQT